MGNERGESNGSAHPSAFGTVGLGFGFKFDETCFFSKVNDGVVSLWLGEGLEYPESHEACWSLCRREFCFSKLGLDTLCRRLT